MRIAFARWRSGGLFNRRSPRKRLLPKKKTSSGSEFVSGLADGASAMPGKWSRPVFSFRFYEGKISRALIVIQHLGGKHTARRHRAKVPRNTDCPSKLASCEPVTERRAQPITGIRQHAAKAHTGRDGTIDLRQSHTGALAELPILNFRIPLFQATPSRPAWADAGFRR